MLLKHAIECDGKVDDLSLSDEVLSDEIKRHKPVDSVLTPQSAGLEVAFGKKGPTCRPCTDPDSGGAPNDNMEDIPTLNDTLGTPPPSCPASPVGSKEREDDRVAAFLPEEPGLRAGEILVEWAQSSRAFGEGRFGPRMLSTDLQLEHALRLLASKPSLDASDSPVLYVLASTNTVLALLIDLSGWHVFDALHDVRTTSKLQKGFYKTEHDEQRQMITVLEKACREFQRDVRRTPLGNWSPNPHRAATPQLGAHSELTHIYVDELASKLAVGLVFHTCPLWTKTVQFIKNAYPLNSKPTKQHIVSLWAELDDMRSLERLAGRPGFPKSFRALCAALEREVATSPLQQHVMDNLNESMEPVLHALTSVSHLSSLFASRPRECMGICAHPSSLQLSSSADDAMVSRAFGCCVCFLDDDTSKEDGSNTFIKCIGCGRGYHKDCAKEEEWWPTRKETGSESSIFCGRCEHLRGVVRNAVATNQLILYTTQLFVEDVEEHLFCEDHLKLRYEQYRSDLVEDQVTNSIVVDVVYCVVCLRTASIRGERRCVHTFSDGSKCLNVLCKHCVADMKLGPTSWVCAGHECSLQLCQTDGVSTVAAPILT